jgi:uncharacterized cupredoxin-like copper-binding protein
LSRRIRVTGLLAVAATTVALSACGSSSSGDSTSTSAAAAPTTSAATTPATTTSAAASGGAKAGGAEEVQLSEFMIMPKVDTVSAGKQTLRVVNVGKVEHALSIEEAGPGGKDIESGDIAPGATKTIAVDLKPGRYEWYCPVGNHKMLGMVGTLVVKS